MLKSRGFIRIRKACVFVCVFRKKSTAKNFSVADFSPRLTRGKLKPYKLIMTKLFKKIFTVGVVATTIFWSLGVAVLVPAVANAATETDCSVLVVGDMVKVADRAAIWVVTANKTKAYFPTGDVYKSWNNVDTYTFKTISADCMSTLTPADGGAILPRPGVYLVEDPSTGFFYAVANGNKLLKITADAAKALYGTKYNKEPKDGGKLIKVSEPNWVLLSKKITTDTVTEAVPTEGSLVKNNGTYYVVGAGKTLQEVSATGLTANRYRTALAYALTATTGYTTGTKVEAESATLVDRTQGLGGTAIPSATPPAATVGGGLTVSLAADTPAAGYAIKSAARVPFTKVTFTASAVGSVTIDQFKVKRGGGSAIDADFSYINVVDPDGNLLNDTGKTLNSDHEATFTEDIVIPAGTSKSYMIVGDMSSATTAGNVPKLALTAITSNATSVAGLPVEGNAMTTNANLTLGTVTLAQGSAIGSITKQVGAANVNLMNLKITNAGGTDTKDVTVDKLVLYNAGTTADADVSNYKLKYNGNLVVDGVMKNKYLTFDLSACGDNCKLAKSTDRTYEVYGDLTAGSGRTVELYVYSATHVLVKDINNLVYLTPTNNAANANINDIITVSQGKLNITKTDAVSTGNVGSNTTGVALASFNFKVTGEPIDVRTLAFKITTSGTVRPTGIDALVLYDKNGKSLIGSKDGVGSDLIGYATSTDTFTLQPGDNILTLKGNIDSTAVSADTIKVDLDLLNTTNFIARGVNSSLDVTLGTYATPQALVQGPTQTVRASALTVTTLTTPAARTYGPGVTNVVFARIMLDASNSSEDIKVTAVALNDETSATAKTVDIQNIRLMVDKDGDSYNGVGAPVALSEVGNGTATSAGADETITYNLSGADQFVIKKAKKLVIEVVGDIVSGATEGTHTFSIDSTNGTTYCSITSIGVSTNTSVTEAYSAASGQAMTIGAAGGQLEVSLASENPNAKILASGTTATLAAFKFLATTTEDVELDYLYLAQVNTVTASSSYMDYDEIWFEDAAGLEIAGTRMSPTNTTPLIDFNDDAFVVKTSDTSGRILYLKAKLATIGTGYNGTSAHRLGYLITAASTNVVAKGDLSGSGATEFAGSSAPTGNTHYVYKAYPVFSRESVASSKLTNGTRDLFKFKVTAVNGDIALGGFTFDITTTTAVVVASSCYLYDATDASEKQVNGTGACGANTTNRVVSVFYGTGEVIQMVGHGDDWDTNFTNDEVTITPAQPRTFILRGNITGATTGASVSVGIAGDSAGVTEETINTLMEAATTVYTEKNNDFIWSDKNNSAHADTTKDWTNGFLVSGLNSSTSTLETVAY